MGSERYRYKLDLEAMHTDDRCDIIELEQTQMRERLVQRLYAIQAEEKQIERQLRRLAPAEPVKGANER